MAGVDRFKCNAMLRPLGRSALPRRPRISPDDPGPE